MNTNQQAGNTSAANNIWDELELNHTESGRDVERFLADGYRLNTLTELLASASDEASASSSLALGCQTPAAMARLWGEVAATSSEGSLLSSAGAPSGGIDIPIDLEEDGSWATSPTSDTVASASPFFNTDICLEEDIMWALPLELPIPGPSQADEPALGAALPERKMTEGQLPAPMLSRAESVLMVERASTPPEAQQGNTAEVENDPDTSPNKDGRPAVALPTAAELADNVDMEEDALETGKHMAVLDQAAESNDVANCETDESVTIDGDNDHDVEVWYSPANGQLKLLNGFQMVDDDCDSPSRVSAGTLDDTTLVCDDSPTPGPSTLGQPEGPDSTATAQATFEVVEAMSWTDKIAEFRRLAAMDDASLVAMKAYGNSTPVLQRATRMQLFQLALNAGWTKQVEKPTERGELKAHHLEALRAEVEADAHELEARMLPGTPAGDALPIIKAIVFGKLDKEIAERTGGDAPQLPEAATRRYAPQELSEFQRKVRRGDRINCVWCGEQRCALQDKGYVAGHLKYTENTLEPNKTRYNCPAFAVLHKRGLLTAWYHAHIAERGLLTAWYHAHIAEVHEDDLWIFGKQAARPGNEELAKLREAAAASQQQDAGDARNPEQAKTTTKATTKGKGKAQPQAQAKSRSTRNHPYQRPDRA
ncbi:hypothetical protein AURDEDRAFT_154417 [Auricularia subglabra TFB-10046 SS5]|uniref:Uncharacterized protein n=1 Tax=Auricularia subglabra (strain TFB-10046 / SS5) TaxID=717982 RepID=J0CZP2_AURST|nr:hypothetical protein AURDEDRAFT_154417 [Auricularia subglabra TFB-10046 SS5]